MGLKVRLKANHYDPSFAHDAESALSAALTEVPDLIILDIGLPRRDGYFVMQSLNAFPDLAGVPVIVLTARDGFTHKRRCHDAGAKRFFEKPVGNRRLLRAIRQTCGINATPSVTSFLPRIRYHDGPELLPVEHARRNGHFITHLGRDGELLPGFAEPLNRGIGPLWYQTHFLQPMALHFCYEYRGTYDPQPVMTPCPPKKHTHRFVGRNRFS